MNKKLISTLAALTLTLGFAACGTETNNETPAETPVVETPSEETEKPSVETFAAEYEIEGTTSEGLPKNDTFIFEGTTEDGIITELNFDIIRNKGKEGEYSKKDLMGYLMNVSDVEIEKVGEDYKLTKFSAAGYDEAIEGAQYMVTASSDVITDTTKFNELSFMNLATQAELSLDDAITAYKYVAVEAGVDDFSEETLVKDLISKFDLYKENSFVEGSNRISFAGYNGGRSYGEQIEAIRTYILEQKMTLEEVYEMFETVNQIDVPVLERDTISGATIVFIGDFQRMVDIAINGEIFEGVVTHTVTDGNTKVEVVTQGYGGEIETHITFDSEGKIIEIAVKDAQETTGIGEVLTKENSEFIKSLIAGQDNIDEVEVVSGATVTSKSLISAIKYATDFYKGL